MTDRFIQIWPKMQVGAVTFRKNSPRVQNCNGIEAQQEKKEETPK
jgi:hypothetical protein